MFRFDNLTHVAVKLHAYPEKLPYNFDNHRSMESLSGMRSEASWPTFCIDDKSEDTLAKASHVSQSKPSQTTVRSQ